MLGAPAYARLAEHVADDPAPAANVLGEAADEYSAIRLFAAVRSLVLRGVAPDALDDSAALDRALRAHAEALRAFVGAHGVQTNETQRCVGLLPAFLTVARETGLPLALVELGASAGLNLQLDRYRYRYANGTWGPDDALLSFDVEERGTVPAGLLATGLEVRSRIGIDLSPVDAATDDGLLHLRSFVWPGRPERERRLELAVETIRREGSPTLVAGDYVEVLPGLLERRAGDVLTIVFQTASTGYVPPARRAELRDALERAGADGRPLAWVSTRLDEERTTDDDSSWELELRVWPGAARLVARLDYHGNWVDWLE
jgi:hypothetical protein